MKSLLAIALIFCMGTFAFSQAQTTTDGPVITFKESSKDFGNIKQGDVVKHKFTFRNTGNQPLIISGVLTTCGCTASDYSKDVVAPGKEGFVEATFNSAGKMGQQNKTLTVNSNAVDPSVRLSIICNVLANEAAAPQDQP